MYHMIYDLVRETNQCSSSVVCRFGKGIVTTHRHHKLNVSYCNRYSNRRNSENGIACYNRHEIEFAFL